MTEQPAARRHTIDLALQGGGSHGAFTWGVLDRLLQEPGLVLAGISGTSAGAMNAVALAAGLMADGRAGARNALRRLWGGVAEMGVWSAPLHAWNELWGSWWGQTLGQTFSPYQLNPLNLNPLRQLLERTIDFDAVRRCDKLRLFVAATHVRSGRLRIFRQAELSADVVLASACLPLLFRAVEIEGESYWDGGFAGNPSLLPLIIESPADDLLLVQINPRLRETVPTSARDILDRMNEVTFNTSLLKELRSIALLKQLIDSEGRPGQHYREPVFQRVDALRLHRIDGEERLSGLGASSKTDTRASFLHRLHDIGHEAADHWLAQHRCDLGQRSTVDLSQEFGA
jgi:NTE family protein